MPTQEERLDTLEYDIKHFKAESINAHQEVALELTIVKGLTEDTVKRLMTIRQDIGELKTTLGKHTTHLNQLETTLGKHTTHLNQLETTLGEHTTHLNRLETTLNEHTTLLTQILARLPKQPE